MFRRLFGSRARRSYEKGIDSYNAGEMSAAIEHFDAALGPDDARRDPEATLARFYRGEAHARLGADALERSDARVALVHFDAALADHPAYPDLHLQRGVALLCLDDALAAERAARQAIERNADFVEAGALLVLALAAQGQTHRAQEERSRWVEIARRIGHAATDLLATEPFGLDELVRFRSAQRARRRDIERIDGLLRAGFWDEASTTLEAMLERTPHYPDLRLRLAAARCGAGDLEAATAHLQVALERNARFADAHVLGGVVALRRDRVGDAARHFGSAEQLGNLGSVVRYGQMLCALRTGAWTPARRQLDALWDDEEFHTEARFLRAGLAWLDGDQESAHVLYEDALTGTTDIDLLVDAACFGWSVGRLSSMRRAIDALPPGAPRPAVAVVRAALLEAEGSRNRAIDVLEAATAGFPDDPALLWALARGHAARGEVDVALRRLANLEALGLGVPGAAALGARLHRTRGDYAAALEVAQRATTEGECDADAALEQLFALRQLGEVERASEHWNRWARALPLDLRWRLQDPRRWLTPLPPWPAAPNARD